MIIHMRILFFTLLTLVVSACGNRGDSQSFSTKVERGNFQEWLSLEGSVEAVNATSINCPRVFDAVVLYIAEDGSFIQAGDTVCILESNRLKEQYERSLTNLEIFEAEYNKGVADLDLSMTLLEAQVRNNEAQTQISNLDSLQLEYSSPSQRKITELQLKRSRIEKRKLESKLKYLRIINQTELRKMQIYINQMKSQVSSLEKELQSLVMLAPKAGLVLLGESPSTDGRLQVGEEIYPNALIASIPEMDQMQVRIQAKEAEVKRLELGQRVDFTFDGMPDSRAQGLIRMIAPVGTPMRGNQSIKLYDVVASIDTASTLPKPGLSAMAQVYLQLEPDTVFVPQLAIFIEDSSRFVYVREGNGYIRQEVQLGLQSSKQAIISGGLKGSETISLIKPKNAAVKETRFLQTKSDSL
ncbi:MAG TPA: HlyD family efflux transporter periplasmic adaptor subunit [Bacteroidales bacterium]|nr:HlyD family efflux transporter periplasmic adaptor subunit [Bacteroidales bacterium]